MADTRATWAAAFAAALEFDAWGQVVEAAAGYQRLAVAAAHEAQEDLLRLPPQRRAAIGQLAAALQARVQELSGSASLGGGGGIGLRGMQALKPFVAGLIVSDVRLPAAIAAALGQSVPGSTSGSGASLLHLHSRRGSADAPAAEASIAEAMGTAAALQPRRSLAGSSGRQPAAGDTAGTLRPPVEQVQPGDVTLSLNFGTWSVKGAAALQQPHLLITVRDGAGQLLEAVQESPHALPSRSGDPDKLDLGFTWHMQAPLNCLPEGAAVFVELRHWKPDKKKMSVKCYAWLPHDQLGRAGMAQLSVYRKPADYRSGGRRALLSTKPLFCHVTRALLKH